MSMTVEEVESEMGASAHGDDDGKLSIDLETFSAWWKKHESGPGGGQGADGCAGLWVVGHWCEIQNGILKHQP